MGPPIPDSEQILMLMLVFLRVSAVLFVIPAFGERTVPARVKGGLAIIITLTVFPFVRADMPSLLQEAQTFAIFTAMIGEIMIGITIGFAVRMIFAGVQFAGEMIGIKMGFYMANIIDPVSSTQVSIIAEFQYLIALLVYLAVDGHHIFLAAITDSYQIVTPLGYHFSGPLMKALIQFSGNLFITAVKIGAPVIAVLFFTNTALGIIARTVPQINIFIVGFPLQIAVGLIFFGLTAPIFVATLQAVMNHLSIDVHTLLKLMS
ncbi:MAG: flagellar biosynthetic protein FliR [Deltaproteobacteria bacterium]|nr:flagellar biosynthetic protein FliR [Deltaproteobacteria bacterium]